MRLIRVQYAKRVRQHESFNPVSLQLVEHVEYIIFRGNHPVRPVFEVYIDLHIKMFSTVDNIPDVIYMLFRRLAKLFLEMS